MNAADSLLLGYLAIRGGFAAHQVAHVRDWFAAAKQPEESLADFLRRQDLLTESAAQIFRQLGEGHLTRPLAFALLDPAEVEPLRRRLPDVAVLEREEDINATMTLLMGDDTFKEMVSGAEAPDEPPRVGGTLGKYLLTEWVGQGANGMVFRALHPTLQIPVAIKVLNPEDGGSSELQERLKAEARLLAQLNHPNIVRLYDFEAHPRYPFLVLEHVNGPTLAELIEQSGRIQPGRVVRIVRQLAEALAAAHQIGIVHRDVKPANILLTRNGDVKLADLGLATVRTPSAVLAAGPMPANARVGTACYMAPELITGAAADERSDMYSLGATFFHALAGEPPFKAERCWQIIEMHAKSPPPSLSGRVAGLTEELSALLQRMLSKNPDERPQTFAGLLKEPALQQMNDASSADVAEES